MIDRQHGKVVFECDCCPETLETEVPDFQEAWAWARREGWQTKKVAGEWMHSCGKCKL